MVLDKQLLHQCIIELSNTIDQLKPQSLVYCTQQKVPVLESLRDEACEAVVHVKDIGELETLPRFELGVVFDFLEHRDAVSGSQLLCRLRNLKCAKLWVAVKTSSDWHFNSMLGFGFKRAHCYTNDNIELCTYVYDIATYNRKREWNNPKYWANPENWGKYRW